MLVQTALLLFAICGMLSLVIDIGAARLSQGQMQNAADAAALEGLRYRDVGVVNPANGQRLNDGFASDCLRRASANRLVRWTFDDDFDLEGGDARQFGAGPVLDASDGATSAHAMQTVGVPDVRSYKPDLQLNQQNAVHGDMVSGRFCYTTEPMPAEGGAYELQEIVCTEPQRGTGIYARGDFNPNDAPPGPPVGLSECPAADAEPPAPFPVPGSGTLTNADNAAFLVRLRRSTELDDQLNRVEDGVASSGPSLPLLLGKGAPIYGDDPAAAYSIRRDGLTVRATAIAAVRPAMHVGLPRTTPAQPGVMPFAVVDTFAAALTQANTVVTVAPATGLICTGVACAGAAPPNAVGRFVDALTDPTRARWTLVDTAGETLPAAVPLNCALIGAFNGYGPVYATLTGGAVRVIGFARLTVAQDPARPANPCAKVIARAPSQVAFANASSTVSGALDLPIGSTAAVVREFFDRHYARNGRPDYAPVLAAALAR